MSVFNLKKMVCKKGVFAGFALAFVVINICFASSVLLANYTNITVSVERSASNIINFTIEAQSENISQVQFRILGSQNFDPDLFEVNSNGTTATGAYFSNISVSSGGGGGNHVEIITFTNTSGAGIIKNETTQNFWFSIFGRSMPMGDMNVTINITGVSGDLNDTNEVVFAMTFRFSGYVKNETGGYQNQTNVSLYKFEQVPNGPPIETFAGSTLTNGNGAFTLSGLPVAGNPNYVLKMIYYNGSGIATKVGSILPPFPGQMYYPQAFSGAFEFMRPPSLNGTTFYIGPAATINITATNGSNRQLFGYMVMEQGTGFPLSSNQMGNNSEVQVIVPTNRIYTIMLGRFNNQFANGAECNGNFMNDTTCGTPPKSNSTLNPTIAGQKIDVQLDMRINRVQMYGCIGVAGNSSVITNVTSILPRMMPWTGFVPPMRADTQDIDLTSDLQLNYSDARCPGKIARYNISLLNSNYLVEVYGRNSSEELVAEWVGAFQNASFEGQDASTNNNVNITLGQLAGNFVESSGTGDTNRSKFVVRIQNSTGGAITQDTPNVNLYVKNSIFGELNFIIEGFTNGTFTIALPLNSTVKAKVFSNNAPPTEKKVNLSTKELNITLTTMAGGDAGFKKTNASGGVERINVTNSDFDIAMRFIRNSAECNILNPPSDCILTSMDVDGFNPFSALVAGKINMEMRMKKTNVSITFFNFDMLSAKQPPMESVMNNEASGGSGSAPVWEFGSFVPADVYDYAVVSIPYNDTAINDSATINISVNNLYDSDWNMVWNKSRGDTSLNVTSDVDDYIGNSNNRSYNSSGYRNLLGGGVECSNSNFSVSTTATSTYCSVNTSANMIYMRVPHFSGVAPLVSGSAPVAASSSSSSSSSSGGGGVSAYNIYSYDEKDFSLYSDINKALGKDDKIKVKINNESHSVTIYSLTNTSVVIKVASTIQTANFSIGDSNKFDVNDDDYYDLRVALNSISNSKADITVSYLHESISTTTLTAEVVNTPASTVTSGLPSTDETSTDSSMFWYIIISLIIIMIVVIYFLTRKFFSKGLNSRVNVLG
ncbi:MAG: hypothetical protein UR91_C0023G0003 [Candidatus Nomurabacteria bacterium GW2011_GWC2_35_8]|uniref:Uncharacterized protein n=1 Tax=Candidatus Nomurabacteria bacterium GW2011_GWC2_35_8 TaxID=1618752 RepID=A0A0G0D1X1_9BACT|nr:MAG: hypothetical protein UR91_C0023G0003 [Candidatus Nomurabacteria bacterium GW2011_GWC2_35_8]